MATGDQVRDDWRTHLLNRCEQCAVPEHLREGLVEYVTARRPVGSFLRACLANDYTDAVLRADDISQTAHYGIAQFLTSTVPAPCWGSREKYDAWLKETQPPQPMFD